MEFLVGTGLAITALGLALFVGVPPPGWPDMPKPLIRFCLGAGVCLFVAGLALMALGGCHESNNVVCESAVSRWSEIKGWALLPIVLFIVAGGFAAVVIRHESPRKRRLSAWGPWILILLCPVLGLIWLALQPAAKRPEGQLIARLAELGWTVKPSENGTQFEAFDRSIPSMKESAPFFAQLNKPFNLHFQIINSLEGLHALAGVANLHKIEINAGKFTDISELRGFSQLTSLFITQLPYEGIRGVVDPEPLSTLVGLEELNLSMSKVQSAAFLASLPHLKSLTLGSTLISDISAAAALTSLQKLEIRDTRISDMRPLSQNQNLSELTISAEQVPGLVSLSKQNLKVLSIIEQRNTDLSPVGTLKTLENLSVWGLPRFDFAQIQGLSSLQRLQISGRGFGTIAAVANGQALGNLAELRTLILGSVLMTDLTFVRSLKNITEIAIGEMPINSIEFLRNVISLKKVTLTDIPVVDISPLLSLPELREVYLLRIPARSDVLTELERRGVLITQH
jgi:Leucine-rich repeat (LRR) protein